MARAMRGHNLGATAAIALLIMLLLMVGLVFVVQRATMTGDQIERPTIGASRAGGPSFARDPYVKHHAGVVTHYHAATPAMGRDGGRSSSLARNPVIGRHAEIVARYNQDNRHS